MDSIILLIWRNSTNRA